MNPKVLQRAVSRGGWLLSAFVCMSALPGCTSTYTHRPEGPAPISGAAKQPFEDVGLIREEPPDILKQASQGPYAMAVPVECRSILEELSELDRVLGPDMAGVKTEKSDGAAGLVVGAIADTLSLPFRGVVRRVSGAEHSQKVLADAILSGLIRRAFLKGAALSFRCSPL